MRRISLLMVVVVLLVVLAAQVQGQGVISNRVSVNLVIGEDDLYYWFCVEGCEIFFRYAPVNELYQGFVDHVDAANQYTRWYNAYHGTNFPMMQRTP